MHISKIYLEIFLLAGYNNTFTACKTGYHSVGSISSTAKHEKLFHRRNGIPATLTRIAEIEKWQQELKSHLDFGSPRLRTS